MDAYRVDFPPFLGILQLLITEALPLQDISDISETFELLYVRFICHNISQTLR